MSKLLKPQYIVASGAIAGIAAILIALLLLGPGEAQGGSPTGHDVETVSFTGPSSMPGATFQTYSATVRNNGPQTENIQVGFFATSPSVPAASVTMTVGSLPPGASVAIPPNISFGVRSMVISAPVDPAETADVSVLVSFPVGFTSGEVGLEVCHAGDPVDGAGRGFPDGPVDCTGANDGFLDDDPSNDALVSIAVTEGAAGTPPAPGEAVDITGDWTVTYQFVGSVVACGYLITQTDSSLFWETGNCGPDAGSLTGIIDPLTGDFFVTGPHSPCGSYSLMGSAAADGNTMAGTAYCDELPGTFTGVRAAVPTPTPTVTETVTPTDTPTDTPTPTPVSVSVVVSGSSGNIKGFFGSIDVEPVYALHADVTFSSPLPNDDYALLLTPIGLTCKPVVTAKTANGFSFQCSPGGGGSIDWAVLVGLTQPTGPGRPEEGPPGRQ